MRSLVVCTYGLVMLAAGSDASAHAGALALLELRELAPGRFAVHWATDRAGLDLEPRLPKACGGEPAAVPAVIDCGPEGLGGRVITFEGRSDADVLVRVVSARGEWSQLGRTSVRIPERVAQKDGGAAVAWRYVRLGVEHIAGGLDHLLFVLGLLLLCRRRREVLMAVTAFTAAHSLTLAAAVLEWVRLPGPPVEASIAASIVLVAREVAVRARSRSDGGGAPGLPVLTGKSATTLAFAFGLVHGLGFASALADVGLPAGELAVALFSFNAGVEVGQLAFVGCAASLAVVLRSRWARPITAALSPPERWRWLAAYGMGAVATAWTLERVVGFWA